MLLRSFSSEAQSASDSPCVGGDSEVIFDCEDVGDGNWIQRLTVPARYQRTPLAQAR